MLGTVEPGDEILTVGGIYGIVQELEPDEDGGDLIVEIADGIHVRIARKALATVIKPEDDDEDDDDEDERRRGRRRCRRRGGRARRRRRASSPAGVAEVTNEGETVNPGAAEPTAPSERS